MATSPNPFDAVITQANQGGQGAAPSNSQQTAQPSAPQQPSDGNPFASIVQQAMSAPQQQSSGDGFFSGLYANTLGPIVHLGKELSEYEAKKAAARRVIEAVGGPYQLLADAITDPQHPLHKLGAGVVRSALDQADQAYRYSGDAATAQKAALSALVQGNLNEASYATQQVNEAALKAMGHGLAAVIPGVGPAAAQAGEDIGDGKTAKGLGEGTGLIASVLAPGAAAKGLGAAGDVVDAVKGKLDTATPAEALRANVTDTAADVAKAGNVEPPPTVTVRNAFDNVADELFTQAKGNYKLIDDATNGRWQVNENALKAVGRKIRTATEEEDLAEAFGRQSELLEDQARIIEEAKAAGVPDDVADNARAVWRQASALQDVQSQINLATEGRQGVTAGEAIQPNRLLPRLVKLYDSGRLADALGSDENAIEFIRDAENAGKSLEAAQHFTKVVKTLGWHSLRGLGIGAGIYGGGQALAHILGGEHAH